MVSSVAFDREGRRIVSGSWDQTVRVWDAASGTELACLRGHDSAVNCVSFDREGRRIVSGSWDKMVRVWDAASEAPSWPASAGTTTRSGAWRSTGRVGGSSAGRDDHTVRVWDAATGDCLEVIQGFGDVAAIAAPASVFPWRAMSQYLNTVIEPASGGEAVAWFPAALGHLATHPSGRIWAGSVRKHLYLIRLEGDPDLIPTGGDS